MILGLREEAERIEGVGSSYQGWQGSTQSSSQAETLRTSSMTLRSPAQRRVSTLDSAATGGIG